MPTSNGCGVCGKPALPNSRFCRPHHAEHKKKQWLNNSDLDNLGIIRWAKEMLPEYCSEEFPEFHKLIYSQLLSLYNPEYRNKYERLYELESFRGSAKSTAANFIFTSYIIAHNGEYSDVKIGNRVVRVLLREEFICIVSETAENAIQFTSRIRDSFLTSTRLRYYYHFQIDEAIADITGQLTRAAFKINGTYVLALGAGQMIRGKVRGHARPTLIILDDIYSENNTITEERRERIKNWFYDAVLNSIDDLKGKCVVLGTIVHEDTILVEIERNDLWRTTKIVAMGHVEEDGTPNVDLFHEFADTHLDINWDMGTCHLPFDDERNQDERFRKQKKYFDSVQNQRDWELAWPDRVDLYYLALKYQMAVRNSSVNGFYQEYFHIPKAPQDRRFKKEYFQYIENYGLEYDSGYDINWLSIGDGKEYPCNIEFGVDLAGKGADSFAITIVGVIPDGRIYILLQKFGKWSIRDDIDGDTSGHMRRDKVCMDRSLVRRIGICDEIFRLSRKFRPSKIKVGVAAEEPIIVEEIDRIFRANGDYTTYIMERPQAGNEGRKEERISNTLLPAYETRMVYHNGPMDRLEYELQYLGKASHDDCADSTECAFYYLYTPGPLERRKKEADTDEDSSSHSASLSIVHIHDVWRTM